MDPYAVGQCAALHSLGIKEAAQRTILVRQRSDPFQDFHKKIDRAFRIKTPKFDISAHLKRLMNNPFKQPTLMLAGKLKPLRI